ncbi:MAG: hypothetical protein MI975_11620 [Cytophagales bacterium]|nr:hypothetical protein [Cytophagales bacterium]
MNYFLLTAGVLAAFATIGHFSMGAKDFLKPVLDSNLDEIPKRVMQSLFHYMSVFMILSSIILLFFSVKDPLVLRGSADAVLVIGMHYAGFAVVQILIALVSNIRGALFKLFQWIFWISIAVLSFIGIN